MFNNLGNIFKHITFADENDAVYSTESEPSALYLTHSELQQVQDVMRETLRNMETDCLRYTGIARRWSRDGHSSDAAVAYNYVSKTKKRIKSLAAIQAKLKHSIVTLG